MAERSDITVDWSQSPRIIWVNWTNAASRELTLQDLHDTAKGILEYDLNALDDPILLVSEGKAELGNEQTVAITATLQNAVIAFRQNTTIDAEGTCTSNDVTGRHLIDAGATFVTAGARAGAHVHNETDNSIATVLKVVSQTELYTTALETGSTNQYHIGDAYDVINPARCSVSGGNLVAVDVNGVEMDQFLPTTNVFVSLTSSASATVQELAAIQYSAFENAVNIDTTNTTGRAVAGTTYPAGSKLAPSNNVADALAINTERGFNAFRVYGLLQLSAGTVWDVEDAVFAGLSNTVSAISIHADALTHNCIFRDLAVTGTLDGNNVLDNCRVTNLLYVEGEIANCRLEGTITLGGIGAHFRNCYTGNLTGTAAVLDLAGGGRSCAIHRYSGRLKITNIVNPNTYVVLTSDAGTTLEIDSTVTAGTIVVTGVGVAVQDSSVGSAQVITTYLTIPETVSNFVLEDSLAAHVTEGGLARTLLSQQTALNGDLSLVRKILLNRLELREGSVNNWILYDDDGVTPFVGWNVVDKDGGPIVLSTGAPTERFPRFGLRSLGDTSTTVDTTAAEIA